MSVYSGSLQAKATEKGTEAQTKSAKEATQALMEIYYQTRTDEAPWREAGAWALGRPAGGVFTQGGPEYDYRPTTQDMFDFDFKPGWTTPDISTKLPEGWEFDPDNPNRIRKLRGGYEPGTTEAWEGSGIIGMLEEGPGDFEASPGYEFRLKKGLKAIESIESAKGRIGSMSTAKRLMDYGQESASQEYDNFMKRYYQKMNPYFSLAGMGQISVGQTGQAGTATAQGVAANTLYSGQAQAAGYQNYANIMQNQSNTAANWAQIYYGAGGAGAAGYGTGYGGYTNYGVGAGL